MQNRDSDTAAAVSTVPAPRELTQSEYKKAMREHFTVVRPRIETCGHKYDPMVQPKFNCEHCWWEWLNRHGDIVNLADEIYRKHGKDALVKLQGEKFYKMFIRFMATLARFKEESEETERINGES